MLCQACVEAESREIREERRAELRPPPETPPPEQPKTSDQQLCSRCGHLIGPAELVKRAEDNHSLLERFGLAGKRSALLKRKPKGDK